MIDGNVYNGNTIAGSNNQAILTVHLRISWGQHDQRKKHLGHSTNHPGWERDSPIF